jgi:hypothetical protein
LLKSQQLKENLFQSTKPRSIRLRRMSISSYRVLETKHKCHVMQQKRNGLRSRLNLRTLVMNRNKSCKKLNEILKILKLTRRNRTRLLNAKLQWQRLRLIKLRVARKSELKLFGFELSRLLLPLSLIHRKQNKLDRKKL